MPIRAEYHRTGMVDERLTESARLVTIGEIPEVHGPIAARG
jgi:hypothetical protein